MTVENDSSRPLSRRDVGRSLKARPALRDDLARVAESVFVVGGEEAPEVETRVVPIERASDGRESLQYEIRLEVLGVRLGEHALPPPFGGEAVREPIPQEQLPDYEELLSPVVPNHLAVEPRPQRLLKAFKRIPERLDDETRYNTTIFDPDDREVFQDTSNPWSAFGRCETNFGPFSGVMIGPRHLLTCNQGVD